MVIPQEFPQFWGETAIFIVTGTREAKIYRASDSVLEVIDECKVETPEYSDKEGFFATRSRDGNMAAGSTLEDVDDQARTAFLKTLSKHLKNVGTIFSNAAVYVFTPSHVKNMVLEKIPGALKNNIKLVFKGNFSKTSPMKVLEKVQADMDEHKMRNTSPEAQKILNKPRQSPSSA